jgi:hypothetical protein
MTFAKIDPLGPTPAVRWSHLAATVSIQNKPQMYVIGGLFYSSKSYSDAYILQLGNLYKRNMWTDYNLICRMQSRSLPFEWDRCMQALPPWVLF